LSNLIDIEYLFKEHYQRLFRVAYKVVNDKYSADDIVQEVFISVWRNKEGLSINTSIEGYLIKATINKSISFLEKNKKQNKTEITDQNEFLSIVHNNQNDFDYEIFQRLVYASLDKLPPKCKTIFILVRFENMKYKDVAEHLGINIKTVENQMSIAISKLNNELKPKLKNYFPEIIFTYFIFFFKFFWG
jgi:RNA polymerase sigma-70 factor, ECF subfamily